MDIKRISKKQDFWEFKLISEDHTLANMIKELSWSHRAEASYRVDHPLIGEPIVKVVSKDPKSALEKVSKDIIKLSKDTIKALK